MFFHGYLNYQHVSPKNDQPNEPKGGSSSKNKQVGINRKDRYRDGVVDLDDLTNDVTDEGEFSLKVLKEQAANHRRRTLAPQDI